MVSRAEDILRAWKIVVPARSTLDELVASVTARVQGDVYTRLTSRLTPTFIQAIDELLQVPLGGHRSMLFQLKEYPAEAALSGHFTLYRALSFPAGFRCRQHGSGRYQSTDDAVLG